MVFLPNYNVSLAEMIVPAPTFPSRSPPPDTEASGTGNMKLALNGALTIGTLDGADVEMRDHVGPENIFIFGLTAAEVEDRRARGLYPRANIEADESLKAVVDAVRSGVFSPADRQRYRGVIDNLTHSDWFLVTDDFTSYAKAQRAIEALWALPSAWREKAILNVARMGWFSSDRTIREYSSEIWGLSNT